MVGEFRQAGRYEQIPQAGSPCLLLEFVHDRQRRPAILGIMQLLRIHSLIRVDVLLHKVLQLRLQLLRTFAELVHWGTPICGEGRAS